MKNKLRFLLDKKAQGDFVSIPSFCTANNLAIKAVLQYAKKNSKIALIEATANQVNQDGGYTGMRPKDFADFVTSIAKEINFPLDNLILGGDHLGPLVWADLPEDQAMANAEILVREFIEAGFTKIHLDTSMRLGSDDQDSMLSDETIASRGARLMQVCKNSYDKIRETNPNAEKPVYIIGSEVPVPGGSRENDEIVTVTSTSALKATYAEYKNTFANHGLADCFDDIIGIVVQPGVEFSDSDVHVYSRDKAKQLSREIKGYNNIVLEGHSTDYQPRLALREMSEDGVGILKVGPALTFAIRAGLFALSNIENVLIPHNQRSSIIKVLDDCMQENPDNWFNYYHGTEAEITIKKHYSYSDRVRYYMSEERVQLAVLKLFNNIDSIIKEIPGGLLHQYMPEQYFKVRDNKLEYTAEQLVLDWVVPFIEDYYLASD